MRFTKLSEHTNYFADSGETDPKLAGSASLQGHHGFRNSALTGSMNEPSLGM